MCLVIGKSVDGTHVLLMYRESASKINQPDVEQENMKTGRRRAKTYIVLVGVTSICGQ